MMPGIALQVGSGSKVLGLRESYEYYLVFSNLSLAAQVDMRLRPSGGPVVGPPVPGPAHGGEAEAASAGSRPVGAAGGRAGFGAFAKGAGFGIKMLEDEVVKPENEKLKYTNATLLQLKPVLMVPPEYLVKNFPELIPPADADGIVNLSASVPVQAREEEDTRDWRARAPPAPSAAYVSTDSSGAPSVGAGAASGAPGGDAGRQWGHKGYEEAKVKDAQRQSPESITGSPRSAQPAMGGDMARSMQGNQYSYSGPDGQQMQQQQGKAVVSNKAAIALPEMKKSKNAWRPGSQVDAKTKLIRAVRDVLNKLTPEKFDKLVNQMLDIGIDSPERLHTCIAQVFEKAVAEPHFVELYAELCAALSKRLPEFASSGADGGKPITFRRVLLNTCQEEFEGTNEAREKLSSLSEEDRPRAEETVKRRTLGNIRLIGELYKKQMVQEKIVHVCITDLLQVKTGDEFPSEESIEALCHLLAAVGKQVDVSPRSKALMDSYMKRLGVLSRNDNMQSRLRFMCRDTVDLRENDWMPRREKEKAKKLKDIHSEAEQAMGIQKGLIANKLHTQSDEAELFPTLDGWVEVGKKGKATTANPDNVVAGNYSALVGTAPALPVQTSASSAAETSESSDASSTTLGKPKVLNLTDEQRAKKAKTMIKEFLSAGDVGEAMYCVEELGGAAAYGEALAKLVVVELIESMERDAKTLNKLIAGLGAKGGLTKAQVVGAIMEQTSQLDDLAIDVPLAPKYVGDLIGACAVDADFDFPVAEVSALLAPVDDAAQRRKCFAFVCEAIKAAKGESTMVSLVKESGINLEELLKGDPQFDKQSVSDFLKSKSLGGLL